MTYGLTCSWFPGTMNAYLSRSKIFANYERGKLPR